MSGQDTRPIAPAPSGVRRSASTPQRKRNTRTACTACKSRRQKCSGEPPCENCQKNGTECEFRFEDDQRRKINLKRKLEGLEEDRDLLLDIFSTLRDSENRHVIDLINQIRNGAKPEDVRLFLDDKMRRSQLERTPELVQAYSEVQRLPGSSQRLDVKRLSDTPTFNVPSKPWTSITDDDTFVSHLISLWFSWNSLFFSWIDPELFLADMKAGKLNCNFCSPFLVNAMLAEACFYSDYPEICAVPGDPTTKGEHFWKEAKRLLDSEEGKVTLPTVQGVAVLYTCTIEMRKDRPGWIYVIQLADYVRTLRASQSRLIAKCGLPQQRVCRLLDRLELSAFSCTTLTCISLLKPAIMKKIPGVRLPVHEDNHQDNWVPYPGQGKPVPAHTNCLINQTASLAEVACDAANALYGDDNKLPRADLEEQVDGWHTRLLDWSSNLPSCMDYKETNLPGVITMHMWFHGQIMTYFSTLRVPERDSGETALTKAKAATETCVSSARAVGELLEIQRTNWGVDPMPVANTQFMVLALFVLTDDLGDLDSRSDFLKMCRALTYASGRWLLIKGMYRLVQLTARKKHEELPEDIKRLFNDFETRYWRPEDTERFSSAYPVFAASLRQEDDYMPDDFELDKFLEKWDDLSIAGKGTMESYRMTSLYPENHDSENIETRLEIEDTRPTACCAPEFLMITLKDLIMLA